MVVLDLGMLVSQTVCENAMTSAFSQPWREMPRLGPFRPAAQPLNYNRDILFLITEVSLCNLAHDGLGPIEETAAL